jgi:hypothetical protein
LWTIKSVSAWLKVTFSMQAKLERVVFGLTNLVLPLPEFFLFLGCLEWG